MITQPSYDTVNLWLPSEQAGAFNPLEVSKRLGKVNNGFNQHTGECFYSGYAGDNYKVSISDNGISLKGSLARYYCGNPDSVLTHLDSLYAIEKLSDELLLPIHKATVKRIDLACNIVTDCKPEAYYQFLGNSRHFDRQPVFESLYYRQKSKQKELILYDKVAELKANKQCIPKEWNGKNILRIELKLMNHLTNQFNRPEILASTLHEGSFFLDMVNKWLAEYEAIEKLNILNLNFAQMKTPKDFKDHILLMQLNELGQVKTMEMIKQMKLMDVMDRPEYYCRLKNDIRQLFNSPKHTTESELIKELNEKVNAVKTML